MFEFAGLKNYLFKKKKIVGGGNIRDYKQIIINSISYKEREEKQIFSSVEAVYNTIACVCIRKTWLLAQYYVSVAVK